MLDPKMKIMSLVCNERRGEHAHLGYRYKREQALIFLDTSQHKTNYHQTHHLSYIYKLIMVNGSGQWTKHEDTQFQRGIVLHGWGSWYTISKEVVKSRTVTQVKSKAQKFMK